MNILSTHSVEHHDHNGHKTIESPHIQEITDTVEHQSASERSTRAQEKHRAHLDAYDAAPQSDEYRKPREERSPAERRGPVTQKQLAHTFNETMHHIQQEMPPSQRVFSKFIHIPAIEKTSDVLSVTIARPNALLAGSICAFALTLGVYLFAKSMGYVLSGFEPIAAFIIGWLLGMLYDYLRVMITGKRRYH